MHSNNLLKIDNANADSLLSENDISTYMQEYLSQRICAIDYISFITPVSLMSIPQLQHAHVLVLWKEFCTEKEL